MLQPGGTGVQVQPLLDKVPSTMPKDTSQLGTLLNRKRRRDSTVQFVASKYSLQSSMASVTTTVALAEPSIMPNVSLQDVKKAALAAMKRALFDESPFPSPRGINRMVKEAIDNAAIIYPGGVYFPLYLYSTTHQLPIDQWKSHLEGEGFARVLKRVVGKVHGDFNRATKAATLLAFDLSLRGPEGSTREQMLALRTYKVNVLLSNKTFVHSFTVCWLY